MESRLILSLRRNSSKLSPTQPSRLRASPSCCLFVRSFRTSRATIRMSVSSYVPSVSFTSSMLSSATSPGVKQWTATRWSRLCCHLLQWSRMPAKSLTQSTSSVPTRSSFHQQSPCWRVTSSTLRRNPREPATGSRTCFVGALSQALL